MIGKMIGNNTTFYFSTFASELISLGSEGRFTLLSLMKLATEITGFFCLVYYNPLNGEYHSTNPLLK